MQNSFTKRFLELLCVCLFPFAVLHAQVDTTTFHQLSGVEILGKVRPSTTRESTPLQVMDKAGIERLGVQDLSEAVKRFSGVTVQTSYKVLPGGSSAFSLSGGMPAYQVWGFFSWSGYLLSEPAPAPVRPDQTSA